MTRTLRSNLVALILVVGLLVGFGAPHSTGAAYAPQSASRQEIAGIYFTSQGKPSQPLIDRLSGANSTIYVMIYSFTLAEVADALIEAQAGGVEVRVVIEKKNAYGKGSQYEWLRDAGVDVRLSGNSSLMHHKVAVIDGSTVITGSFNWSSNADAKNDENMVVLVNPPAAQAFSGEFWRVWDLSSP
jgi:phosphatidylserine/phosphatidylglycerophosphate/cardiolipin synthase-like enzyme